MTTYHPVECADKADVLYVVSLCVAEGYSYNINGLIVTFWK